MRQPGHSMMGHGEEERRVKGHSSRGRWAPVASTWCSCTGGVGGGGGGEVRQGHGGGWSMGTHHHDMVGGEGRQGHSRAGGGEGAIGAQRGGDGWVGQGAVQSGRRVRRNKGEKRSEGVERGEPCRTAL